MQGLPKKPSETQADWLQSTAETYVQLTKIVLVLGNRNAINIKDFRERKCCC